MTKYAHAAISAMVVAAALASAPAMAETLNLKADLTGASEVPPVNSPGKGNVIATYDTGQEPQRGGWLTATHGKGTWTYFAYALHRQLPYGVPGAYRITANLLALGKRP